ncbi:hypothetical protein Tco_0667888 [Tanacetum coccineum]
MPLRAIVEYTLLPQAGALPNTRSSLNEMRPLAMYVPEPRWGSSVPIDLFTAFVLGIMDFYNLVLLIQLDTAGDDLIIKEKMESQSETTQTVSALKLLVLKTGDYDLWSMIMEQYLTHTDYAL